MSSPHPNDSDLNPPRRRSVQSPAPRSQTPDRPESSTRKPRKRNNPLLALAIWASSLIAAIVVALLIINSSMFQSFRNRINNTEVAQTSGKAASARRPEVKNHFQDAPMQELPKRFELKDNHIQEVPARTDPASPTSQGEPGTEADPPSMIDPAHTRKPATPPTPPEKPAPNPSPKTTPPQETPAGAHGTQQDPSNAPSGSDPIKPSGITRGPFQTAGNEEKSPVTPSNPEQVSPKPRLPIPDKTAQRKSLKEIKTLLKTHYSQRTDQGKQALVTELVKLGKETHDDPVARYTSLMEAIKIATQNGNVQAVCDATDLICETFEVDSDKMRSETMGNLIRKITSNEQAYLLFDRSHTVVQNFIDHNQYKEASDLSRKLASLAKKMNNIYLIERQEERLDRIKKMDRGYRAISDAREKLKADPQDAEANQAVGEFYCFIKGDFEKGLPHLARGTNPTTRKIARLELAGPATTEEKLALADQWWDYQDSLDSDPSSIELHCATLYESIVTELKGVARKRVEQRIHSIHSRHTPKIVGSWKFHWPTQSDWERAEFSHDGTITIHIQNNNDAKTYRWQTTDAGIVVYTSSKTRYFLFVWETPDRLIGKKIDGPSQKALDSCVGIRLDPR